MKVGDLVTSNAFIFSNYGIGIVIGREFGGLKVYWPEQGCWCYTSEKGVKLL